MIVSPGENSPRRSARASGFSTSRWIVRLSGRAPYAGSVPSRTISARAAGVELDREVLLGEPPLEALEQQVDDLRRGRSSVSAWKTMISSTRLRNSGRNWARSASVTWRFIAS